MLLSRLHYPVSNLGYGVRAGIWFQGCTVYCKGCVSRDTWAFDESRRCDVGEVTSWLDALDGPVDGITISGGEPTDQPDALRALLEELAVRRTDTDILMYSGRSTERLTAELPWLWDHLDVLISEPFDQARAADCALRGSANQRVHRLSPLAEQRYPEDAFEQLYEPQRQQIALHVDGRSIWMVGIPKPGDLTRLQSSLEARGISLGRTSWLS
jgi:anaerobic ribonucleoside-triphosphate reductase activating protein